MANEAENVRMISEESSEQIESLELRGASERTTSSFSRKWSGAVTGTFIPSWWDSDLTIPGEAVTLFLAKNVFYIPSLGAVISSNGEVFARTIRHALYFDPKMERVQEIWSRRAHAPRLNSGAITVPWGALHNYGHFLLDTMTSAHAFAQQNEFQSYPFLAPPLHDWQRQHFKLADIEPLELSEPIYALERVAFLSGIKSSLHTPNLHFLELRDSQLANLPAKPCGAAKIYISRRGYKRPLLNEPELEAELSALGFSVVKPETLSVVEQIEIFRSAKVVVAPTGAALANLLYAKQATVFEIIPQSMTRVARGAKWVAFLTAMGEGDWRPYFGLDAQNVNDEKRPGYVPFEVSVPDLLKYIAMENG
jgi:capsular polysaccharide biosynthesis protein